MKLTKEEEEKLEELCQQSFDFAREDDEESLKILLDSGLNVNLANHKGNTLLMLASYNNSIKCTKLLLENGAEVDKKNDKNQTPLAGACFKGYIDIVNLLIEYGADVDADNGMGLTPINCAIIFRRKEIAKLLLKHTKKKMSFMQKMGIKILL